jgi:prepilin-type N-terminal cleavage/methylation domain-containing protein
MFHTVPPAPTFHQRGFTLVELAIVMFIVALLLGGMLLPLSAQQDVRSYGDTQKLLSDARDALLGFAMANDRLPCPASSTSNGVESLVSPGVCTNPHDGFFPAATLGMAPVDGSGYLIDGWGSDIGNRVRYAVTTSNTNAFTTEGSMKSIISTAPPGIWPLTPDLIICSTGTGLTGEGTAGAACAANASLATEAVAVIYSLGKNAGTGGTSDDEKHNPNRLTPPVPAPDRAFVNAQQGTNFDDQVIWLSKGTLFNRMVAAGRLP